MNKAEAFHKWCAASRYSFTVQETFEAGWEAALAAVKAGEVALKPPEYAWECNECGSQEYTMCVSEDDVNRLGCGNCGGDEWHKAEVKP